MSEREPILSELVRVVPIPSIPFPELIDNDNVSKAFDPDSPDFASRTGVLEIYSGELGRGAMKTCVEGRLQVMDWERDYAGPQGPAAIKRFYTTDRNQRLARLPSGAEKSKCRQEGALLMWSISILNHSLSYVQLIAAQNPCPLPIYNLRFSPMALVSVDSKGSKKTTTYLVEDRIPGLWQKYIGNANAVPIIASDEEGYKRAEFMSFLQHVQFEKTRGLAYISDWQGKGAQVSYAMLSVLISAIRFGRYSV